MKLISLTKGVYAKVDNFLYDELNQHKWFCALGYAVRKRKKSDLSGGLRVHMSHEVLRLTGVSIPKGYEVDHINRDRADNRMVNLRAVTRSENVKNSDFTKTRARLAKMAQEKTKKVIDVSTGYIYNSTLEVSKKFGIPRNTLRGMLNGNKTNKTTFRYY